MKMPTRKRMVSQSRPLIILTVSSRLSLRMARNQTRPAIPSTMTMRPEASEMPVWKKEL